jgi:dipeptidyl aminopeptidase/acylaminoacyl peptidase
MTRKIFNLGWALVWLIIACGCSTVTSVMPTETFAQKLADGYHDVIKAYGDKIILEKAENGPPTKFFLFDLKSYNIEQIRRGYYSPDGTILAIDTQYYGGSGERWSFVDAGTQAVLAGLDFDGQEMAWNPDGSQIAILKGQAGQIVIHLLETRTWTLLQSLMLDYDQPTLPYVKDAMWSPDGRRIALTIDQKDRATKFGRSAIYIADLSTQRLSAIANVPDIDFANPNWSPDGHVIVLRSRSVKRTFDSYLAFVDVELGCMQVYPDIRFESSVVWMPNSEQIIYGASGIVYGVDVGSIPERYHIPGKMCVAEGTLSPTPTK